MVNILQYSCFSGSLHWFEVMGSAGKHQLLSFMDELIPTIRTALCDRYAFLLFFLLFLSDVLI